jgi:hypothetical protein
VTRVAHEVNTYLSNAVFPATQLSFPWYSVIQHAYCKIFGYSHKMNQLIIGQVLIIAFLLKMFQITTSWSLALFMRNALYRRNGQTLPKLAALFYKYTKTAQSIQGLGQWLSILFIYVFTYSPRQSIPCHEVSRTTGQSKWVRIAGVLNKYRGAAKSLARPGRKNGTATEDLEFHISYL